MACSVQHVVAETMAVNLASRRVMEKVGLRLVRTFHQPWPDPIAGAAYGDVAYALRKVEWEQHHGEVGEQAARDDRPVA
jgi:RimJ/RimL family protein N-acetyltransferase